MNNRIIRKRPFAGTNPIPDDQALGPCADRHSVAIADLSGKQHLRQWILQCPLDHPLQRTRTEHRVITLIGKPGFRAVVQFQPDLAPDEALFKPGQL